MVAVRSQRSSTVPPRREIDRIKERRDGLQSALDHMEAALAQLDALGASLAAARLSHAIETLRAEGQDLKTADQASDSSRKAATRIASSSSM
jgi:hypothetical protein